MSKNKLYPVFLLVLCLSLLLGMAAFPASAEEVSLWLVTEETTSDGINAVVLSKMEQFQQEHPGVSIRMDILPNTEDARQEYLQSLRAQMDNGTGPDLFLLPTGWTVTLDHPKKFTWRRITPLFPDAAAAMADGAFADISTWYDEDDALGKEGLNQAVMDAGTLDGARYILPLRYSVPVIYTVDELLEEAGISPQTLEGSISSIMDEAVQSQNLSLACCVDMASANVFSNLTTQGDGALTAAQVADYLRLYQALKALIGTDSTHLSRFEYLWRFSEGDALRPAYLGTNCDALCLLAAADASGQTLSMYPLRSTTGDTMAFISYYGAVNSSCRTPELAYEFLRQFLLEDVQWEQGRNTADSEWSFSPMAGGWPVRTLGSVQALWENIRESMADSGAYRFRSSLRLDDSSMPILETELDLIRFPVQTSFGIMISQLNDERNGNVPSDADVDTLAEEFISSLQNQN